MVSRMSGWQERRLLEEDIFTVPRGLEDDRSEVAKAKKKEITAGKRKRQEDEKKKSRKKRCKTDKGRRECEFFSVPLKASFSRCRCCTMLP
jgi:hypothetical protein